MKKSFKKAGAAVLSMAMLLSMGAVSLPVYAADTHNIKPTQLEVTIATTDADKHADDSDHAYDYLQDVNSATVKMYRVATLTPNGWKWDSSIKDTLADSNPDVEDDFNDLLARHNVSVTDQGVRTEIEPGEEGYNDATAVPVLDADTLQALASKLERLSGSLTPIATGTVTKNGDTYTPALLPPDDKLYSDLTSETTKNVIGYYLLVTDTDDAGVVIQPVLVPVGNTDISVTGTGSDKKTVALKGTNIDIDKSIERVYTKSTVTDGETTTNVEYEEAGAISETNDTATVSKDDTISYQIKAQLPKYDTNLAAVVASTGAKNIKDFTITDTPDEGIIIGAKNTSIVSPITKNPGIKVYYDEDGTYGEESEILEEGVDYTIERDANSEKFVIRMTALQFRGQKVTGTGNNAKIETNDAATIDGTMENGYIFVQFDATIDETLNRHYDEALTITEVTFAQARSILLTDPGEAPTAVADPGENGTQQQKDAYQAYLTSLETWQAKKDAYDAQQTALNAVAEADYAAILKTAANAEDSTVVDKANWGGDTATTTDRKAAVLYMKAENERRAAAVGNKNVAKMEYGNKFATGQGNGNDEDTTTVFTVDVNLKKVVLDKLVDGTDKDTAKDKIEEKAVEGAVFELFKSYTSVEQDDGSSTTAGNYSCGVAVSDSEGRLWLAEKITVGGVEKYVPLRYEINNDGSFKKNADGSLKKVDYSEDANSAYQNDATSKPFAAWIELQQGTYYLREIEAPAGYKKWGSDQTFTIDAEKTGKEYNGVYTGSSTSTGFGGTPGSQGVEAVTKTFTFVNDVEDENVGELKNNIIDEYEDRLPATGGIGTVLFTAGGISIVLIAGALFVMYMKKRNAEDEE